MATEWKCDYFLNMEQFVLIIFKHQVNLFNQNKNFERLDNEFEKTI